MKRGDIWTASRSGHDRTVVIVGHEAVTQVRKSVLVVPISAAVPPGVVEPVVSDSNGAVLGVAQIPQVGEVSKECLRACTGTLEPASVEAITMSLRAALDL